MWIADGCHVSCIALMCHSWFYGWNHLPILQTSTGAPPALSDGIPMARIRLPLALLFVTQLRSTETQLLVITMQQAQTLRKSACKCRLSAHIRPSQSSPLSRVIYMGTLEQILTSDKTQISFGSHTPTTCNLRGNCTRWLLRARVKRMLIFECA